MSFLTKHNTNVNQAGGASGVDGLLKECPAVLEYMSADSYPDGERRDRATLMFFVEGGIVKVCLSDKTTGRTLWRSGTSIDECLISLEQCIVDGQADWRMSAKSRQASGKK